MTSKEELLSWANGIEAYRQGDFDTALDCFQSIPSFSRIHFNTGLIYTRLTDYPSALSYYSQALDSDPYLAVAYFQRSYCFFMLEDYNSAERDYAACLDLLRENDYIDYSQLGLKYRLYRCEIHFNRAMCWHSLAVSGGGDYGELQQYVSSDIAMAQRCCRTNEQKDIVGRAARVGVETVTLFTVPSDAVFEVSEQKLKNLKGKQFLPDAKVVVDKMGEGGWSGFDGAAIVVPEIVTTNSDSGVEAAAATVVRNKTLLRRASDPERDKNRMDSRGMDMGRGRSNTVDSPSGVTRLNTLNTLPSNTGGSGSAGGTVGRYNTAPAGSGGTASRVQPPRRAGPSNGTGYAFPSQQQQQYSLNRSYSDNSMRRDYPSPTASPSNGSSLGRSLTNNNNNNNQQPMMYNDNNSLPRNNSVASFSSYTRSKLKLKLHTLSPLPQKTILLLLDNNNNTNSVPSYVFLLTKAIQKLNLPYEVEELSLSFRDPDAGGNVNGERNGGGGGGGRDGDAGAAARISILDDDDLAVAWEVMGEEGRWEVFVGVNE
ncbi:hypothetical protein BC832DRAFT_542028 [Gaertneriomyces semiglobifer]|nr:hypothetical protein BC832DRAFT_542028 [Gaertneriomyces semiglobifer]